MIPHLEGQGSQAPRTAQGSLCLDLALLQPVLLYGAKPHSCFCRTQRLFHDPTPDSPWRSKEKKLAAETNAQALPGTRMLPKPSPFLRVWLSHSLLQDVLFPLKLSTQFPAMRLLPPAFHAACCLGPPALSFCPPRPATFLLTKRELTAGSTRSP